MKKLLSIVLFLSMMLTLLSSCGTETKKQPLTQNQTQAQNPPEEQKVENTTYTYGEDLFKNGLILIESDKKYGYMDKNGNTVIECIYDEATDFYDGIAFVCSQDNQILCIDTNGDTLATVNEPDKFVYNDYSSVVNAIGYAYKLGLIEKNGEFLYDGNYCFEETSELITSAGYVKIADKTSGNTKYGIYDLNKHTVSIPPIYDNLSCAFSDEYIIAQKDELVQVLNFNGDVVGELPLENLYSVFSEGYVPARNKNTTLCGYADHTGKYVIPPKYRSVSTFNDGTAAVSISEGSYYLIDKEEKILSGTYENMFQVSDLSTLYGVNKGKHVGIIDKNGNEILPPVYDTLYTQKSGHIIVTKNNILYIYDPDGKQIMEYTIPNNYIYVFSNGIFDDGYIHIRVANTNNNKYCDGVIDANGKLVLGFNYNFG